MKCVEVANKEELRTMMTQILVNYSPKYVFVFLCFLQSRLKLYVYNILTKYAQ